MYVSAYVPFGMKKLNVLAHMNMYYIYVRVHSLYIPKISHMHVHTCMCVHTYIYIYMQMYKYVRAWKICVNACAYISFAYVHACVCRAYLCLNIGFQFFDGCQSIRQLSLEFRNIIWVIGTQFFALVSRVQSIRQLCLEFRNIILCIGTQFLALLARVQSIAQLFLEFGILLFGIGEEFSGVRSFALLCFQ